MRSLLKAALLLALTCVFAVYWDRALVTATSPLLCAIALRALGSLSSAVVKGLLAFHAFYLATSMLVQLVVLGSAEHINTLVMTFKLFTLSLCSIAVARSLFPLLARRACSSWAMRSLLIAMRSAAETYALLSDSMDAVRVNYGGPRARLNVRLLRLILEGLPELVLDTTLRRFEVLVTMMPGSCRGQGLVGRGEEARNRQGR